MSTAVTAAVATALWLGCLSAVPPWAAAVAIVVLGCAVPVVAGGRVVAGALLVLLGMVLLGGGLTGGRAVLRDGSPLVALGQRRAIVEVVGRVATEPRVTPIGAWAILRVARVGVTDLGGRAVLHLDDGDDLDVGQRLDARMRVVPLPDDGFGAHVRTLGASVGVQPVGALRVGRAPALLRRTTVVRDRARAAYGEALGRDRAALLGGLTLGTRDDIDDDLLRDAGLSHLVVVSGRHVAVLLAGVLAVAAVAGLGHRGCQRAALVALWWFVVLTRWQPSVLRAAVMATLVVAAALSGRGRDALHGLAVTVLFLLLCDPLLARQAGFALSVLATGGVLLAVQRADAAGVSPLRMAVRATVAAQIATAPVLLTMVGTVPLAALPANLVAGPAATVAQLLGLCAAALAALDLPGAAVVAGLAGPPLAILQWAAMAFSGLPALGAGELVGIVVFCCCVGVVRRRPGPTRRPTTRVVALILGGLVATVLVAPWIVPPRRPEQLRLVAIDVGQGDALLVEAPDGADGARMLVDGGPEPTTIDVALRRRRIRDLDVVVLTHGDHDHAGGLARVLRRRDVGALALPAGDAALRDASDSAREALSTARRRGVPVVAVAEGRRFALGDAQVSVLAPSARMPAGVERNARSIVLRVDGTHGSMLLTGDAEEGTQLRLLGRPSAIRADVLKVPHHGGATNATGFLDAVGARVAVVSVGAGNGYGHPHHDTVADMAPVPLWRTDRHGSITVTLTPDGPSVETERAP